MSDGFPNIIFQRQGGIQNQVDRISSQVSIKIINFDQNTTMRFALIFPFFLPATSVALLAPKNPQRTCVYPKTPEFSSVRLFGEIDESREKLQDSVQEHVKVVKEKSIDDTNETVQNTLDNVKDGAQDLKQKAQEKSDEMKDDDDDEEGITDKLKDKAIGAKEVVKDVAVSAKDKLASAKEAVKDTFGSK
jgi:hypothetical protein